MTLRVCPRCDARFRGDIATCPIDGTTLREPEDPFVGRTIAGRYLIEEQLGSGGMGAVYRARHQIIGRDVALKFLEPALVRNERQRKRFLGEARAANQINHEHIIDITDFGETEDGLVYMVMEYLEGKPLSEEIEKGPLPPRRALRIATQISLGLARAHELGVVHRDIKPANIYLIRRKADPDYVKVLDFGVARIEHDMRITGQGTIVGTPEYIAPEQIHTATAMPSADLYSLGCVLFEMLTGRLPFEGKTTILLVKHLNDPPPTPSHFAPNIPASVDQLVVRLMQKEPNQRYRDAYHLVEALQQLLDELPPVSRVRSGLHESVQDITDGDVLVPGPTEEESLQRTIELYRALVHDAHPKGSQPSWLPQAIEYLETTVNEVRALRQQLREAAERATAQEEQTRTPRDRIGRALDELAKDDSRLTRQIESLAETLRSADERLDRAMSRVIEAAEPLHLHPGKALTASEQVAVGKLVEGAKRLASERQTATGARTELETRRREQHDLRFQIAELKEQLQGIQGSATVDQQLAHDDVTRISAQIGAKLEAMAPYSNRITQHFSQFPELRQRLSDPPRL